MKDCKKECVSNPVSVFEALDETDIEKLSKFDLTEEELSNVLSLFEIISDDNKEKAMNTLQALFSNKKLVPVESEDVKENKNTKLVRNISERYTRILLGE